MDNCLKIGLYYASYAASVPPNTKTNTFLTCTYVRAPAKGSILVVTQNRHILSHPLITSCVEIQLQILPPQKQQLYRHESDWRTNMVNIKNIYFHSPILVFQHVQSLKQNRFPI